MTMGDKKPKAYTFTKEAGPQFNLLPDAEPVVYFSLFFNDELSNNFLWRQTGMRDTKCRSFSLA
jgi:hypothetical protein